MRPNVFLSTLFSTPKFLLLRVLCFPLFVICFAPAQTFTVLHTFTGPPDGIFPDSLLLDSSGNFYGTTFSGGASYYGTAFKLSPSGKERVLYNFVGGYGTYPDSQMVRDAKGTLYGTTSSGGAYNDGAVFKLDTKGNETVLYSFTAQADGYQPNGVVLDDSGTLYGTTKHGGSGCCGCCGTVFKVTTAGKLTVLHNFADDAGGAYPSGSLLRDSSGNLYGTTLEGGDLTCFAPYGCGTVFKLSKSGKETVLYSFHATGEDGDNPDTGVVRDTAGNFYGTTVYGGLSNCHGVPGCGTVFKLDSGGKETVLYRFGSAGGDGTNPSGPPVLDAAGNIYGTTYYGGTTSCGCGVVFMLDTNGKETILYTFTGGADGAHPFTPALLDKSGNIYGTASAGGDLSCGQDQGCGTVFKLTP